MKSESPSIAEQASETVDHFAGAAAQAAGNLRREVSDGAAKALSKAGAEADNFRGAVTDVVDRFGAEAREFIRAKPMGALAAAAAFGLMVGLATRR